MSAVNQQTIVNAINPPNCYLYTGQDIYGNDVQALVPFGKEPDAVFGDIEDWDGAQLVKGPVVFASTIRAVMFASAGVKE